MTLSSDDVRSVQRGPQQVISYAFTCPAHFIEDRVNNPDYWVFYDIGCFCDAPCRVTHVTVSSVYSFQDQSYALGPFIIVLAVISGSSAGGLLGSPLSRIHFPSPLQQPRGVLDPQCDVVCTGFGPTDGTPLYGRHSFDLGPYTHFVIFYRVLQMPVIPPVGSVFTGLLTMNLAFLSDE